MAILLLPYQNTGWSHYQRFFNCRYCPERRLVHLRRRKHAVIGLTEVLADDVRHLSIKVTLVAPGVFRTNFNNPDSLVLSQRKIDAYSEVRSQQEKFAAKSGTQIGDPAKAAEVMMEIAGMAQPPLYLLLGSDAYARAFARLDLLSSTYKEWEVLTKSTDFSA